MCDAMNRQNERCDLFTNAAWMLVREDGKDTISFPRMKRVSLCDTHTKKLNKKGHIRVVNADRTGIVYKKI